MHEFDIADGQVQLTIVLKLQKLRREAQLDISYDNMIDYLMGFVWKNNIPNSLHAAVNDVFRLTADELVRYLSTKAIIDGYKTDLSEFSDLIGGSVNE